MTSPTRRTFIQHAGVAATAATTLSRVNLSQAQSANERPIVGFIGCGGRANQLGRDFSSISDIAWACDPDRTRRSEFQQTVGPLQASGDLRRVLDDASVDAVVIATPDHWHAPAAILACEAGKHVYVEKPCSHNLREGRLLVEAARRNNVVVQHGTQSRTNPLIAGAVQMLREGVIGDVLMAKAWNVQRRKDIGRLTPSNHPVTVDYDAWIGPAPFVPFQTNRFHYDWHWWYAFGTGDIGNDGTHEIDIARWGLGVEGLPAHVSAIGGKYFFDDDQEFPDTATCAFEWPSAIAEGASRQLVFEMRLWSTSYPHNCDTGVEFHGTQGMLFVSKRGKLEVFSDRNTRVVDAAPKTPPVLAASHAADFLTSVAERRTPAADIAVGHDSVALVHLANTAVRVGRSLTVDVEAESIVGDAAANGLLAREYREGGHWAVPQGL